MKKIFFTLMTVLLATLATRAATPINVAGKDISCSQDITLTASDVSDIKSGTVTYTKSTNTLTLTNVTITRTGSGSYCIHNRSQKGLTVKFVGTCNLTSTNARVIRFQCGGASSGYQCKLVAASGATVNMSSTNDGAIYVRDNTLLLIEGPGTFNITGQRDGAIAGHGSWNATITDPATKDYISFSNVTATVTGAQGSLLGLETVQFSAGSNVILKATNSSSYPVTRQIKALTLLGNTTILAPWGAYYSSNNQSVVLNGSSVYNQNIYVSDNYALLLNATNFPDANFRSYMLSLYPKGYLTTAEVNSLTYLDISFKDISNMKGIEKLTALKKLLCYGNSITSLNLNSNTALTYLACNATPLTTLDVTGNRLLEYLDCSDTYLASITGLANCAALKYFDCHDCSINNLSALNSLNNLESVDCGNAPITSLTLTNKSELKYVSAYNTSLITATITGNRALTELHMSDCSALTTLNCYNNALTELSIDFCHALTTLNCYSNDLTSLNLSGNTAMTGLWCWNNPNLATITGLADCTALVSLRCNGCAITDLSACNSMDYLQELNCKGNKITELRLAHKSLLTEVNASNNPNLTDAGIYGNSILTDLDISNCTALFDLNCSDNNLTTLDVTGCTSLDYFGCYANDNLASVTGLANCAALRNFSCWDCAITDLSALNSLNNLEYVECYGNNLTSLTLTNKSKLKEVDANSNSLLTTVTITGNSALTKISLWQNTAALKTLKCYNNNLSFLSVEGKTSLEHLDCGGNENLSSVTGLATCTALKYFSSNDCPITDLSALNSLNNLEQVSCSNNKITSLTVTGKSKLTSVYCYNNPNMTTLTVANNSALKVLNIKNNTAMTSAICSNNALTTLTVTGNTALMSLYCYNNQLTSLNVQGCNALNTLVCYKNKISGTGMTTLVNSLPTRTASAPGTMRVIYNSNENNTMTAAQITTARGKHWNPKKYNGSTWVDLTSSTRGDVDGSGQVNISDVTALIDYLLSGNAIGVNLDAADCDQSGSINISDVTALIDYLLSGNW